MKKKNLLEKFGIIIMPKDRLYTTFELENKINELYEKLKVRAVEDGIYRPIDIYFSTLTPRIIEGLYCYSDKRGYHYCYTERGEVSMHRKTNDFFKLSYWILDDQIFSLAQAYELKHRVGNEDSRRLTFHKELQLFAIIGSDYAQKAKSDIDAILKKAPYNSKKSREVYQRSS